MARGMMGGGCTVVEVGGVGGRLKGLFPCLRSDEFADEL